MLTASSSLRDTSAALDEVLAQLDPSGAELLVLFYSTDHDTRQIARALDEATGERGVAGSTLHPLVDGEFHTSGMLGMSFRGHGIRAGLEIIPQLEKLSLVTMINLPELLARRIDRTLDQLDPSKHLWLTMLDASTRQESLLTPFFSRQGPQLPLIGGALSAAKGEEITLINHGRVYQDAAVIILLEYEGPHAYLNFNPMKSSERWVDATGVSEGGRLLTHIDGVPAIEAYGEIAGTDDITTLLDVAHRHPLGRRFRGRATPISIIDIIPNEGLVLGIPIMQGERLNVLTHADTLRELDESIEATCARLGQHDHIACLMFTCVGLHTATRVSGQEHELAQLLTRWGSCAPMTHSEFIGPQHLNHSITGVLFG